MALKAAPPVLPPDLVPRPALAHRLGEGASRPVTLVCAGPGTGKTLTVASWARSDEAPWPVAWLSLDAADNTLQAFWSAVLCSLSDCGVTPREGSLRDLSPATGFGPEEVLAVRAILASLPLPVVLVLDDFHEITDDAVLATFGELVDHLPDSLRLVLISRSDPTLRLHRLRASGELTEIRTADLAFSQVEAAILFEQAGIPLRAEQVAVVRERTEGWAVGLRLAAFSFAAGDLDAAIGRLSGSNRAIADYLIGELMQRLSPDTRDFLLRTSVVERISGPLADHLTGRSDGQALLEGLARANAFVVAIGGGFGWFSYHRMLRELLLYRLALEQPKVLREAHLAAARWLLESGEPIEAIRHSIAGDDTVGAGRILLKVIPKVVSPEGPALAAAVAPLAAEAPEKPGLATLLAAATWHFHHHQFAAMQRDVDAAREFLDDAGDTRTSAEAMLSTYDMAYRRTVADSEAVQRLAQQVIDIVDRTPRRLFPAGPALRSIAVINRAGAQIWTGSADDTVMSLENEAETARELQLLLPHLNAIGHLALSDVLVGRCTSASRRTAEAMEIIDRRGWGSEPQALATYLAQALVDLARQRPTEAGHHVSRGLSSSVHHTDRALRLALGAARVEVAVGRGDARAAMAADERVLDGLERTPDATAVLRTLIAVAGADALLLAGQPERAAARLLADSPTSNRNGSAIPATLTGRERICLARAALATGAIGRVPALIEPVLARPTVDREATIAAHLLLAVLADRSHRDTAAFAAIETAVDLAYPERIRRPFVAVGDRVGSILMRHRQIGERHDAFSAEILALLQPSPPPAGVGTVITETLTDREGIVLRYLPTMLKAGEIADELFVSVNTVKAHLRAIYRKLGVGNRREAVERARAAGLL